MSGGAIDNEGSKRARRRTWFKKEARRRGNPEKNLVNLDGTRSWKF